MTRIPIAGKAVPPRNRVRALWLSRYTCPLILVFLAALIISANYLWITTETRPPHWDMGRHLWTSLHYWELFQNHQLLPLLQHYAYYPPLLYWAVIPFYILFGVNVEAAVMSNTIFILILLFSVYFLGVRIASRAAGLIAAILCLSYPMLITQFKELQLDAPLTAMVALALCLLLYSEAFRKPAYSIAFGVVCGLGMLTKWTFVACMLLPVIWAVVLAAKADFRERRPRRLVVAGAAVLLAYTVASPWYAANIQQLQIDTKVNGAEQALREGDPLPGSLAAAVWYVPNLVNQQVFLPGALLFLVGIGALAWQRRLRPELMYPALLILGTYTAFALLANKDARYTLPMLPAVSLFSVIWIGMLKTTPRRLVYTGIALYGAAMFWVISFGWKVLPANIEASLAGKPVTVFAQRGYIIGPPTNEDWGLQEIFAYLERQPPAARSLAYSGSDTMWLNGWGMAYFHRRFGVPIATPAEANYVLERTSGGAGSGAVVMRSTLPDKTILTLYKRR